MSKGFRVTVEDLDTGEAQAMIVTNGDYMLIPFAPCYLHQSQKYANGTVTVTLKDHRPRASAQVVQPALSSPPRQERKK